MKPTYGLTDEQVENMILDSFDHAEEDFAKRLLIEARNEADSILGAVGKAPQNPAWNQLSAEEQTAIAAARDWLTMVKQTSNLGAISQAIVALDKATRHFAELMMDAAVSSAIRGKTMNERWRGAGRGGDCSARFCAGGVQVSSGVGVAGGVSAKKARTMTEKAQSEISPDKLVRVTFLPEGRTVEFEFGTMPYDHHGMPMSFLDVAENFGVILDHACGGSCACTTATYG